MRVYFISDEGRYDREKSSGIFEILSSIDNVKLLGERSRDYQILTPKIKENIRQCDVLVFVYDKYEVNAFLSQLLDFVLLYKMPFLLIAQDEILSHEKVLILNEKTFNIDKKTFNIDEKILSFFSVSLSTSSWTSAAEIYKVFNNIKIRYSLRYSCEEAFQALNEKVFTETNKYLTDTQKDIFIGSFKELSYQRIAVIFGFSYEHVKSPGKKLWELISEVLGEEVKKSNFKSALDRFMK